MTAAQCKQGIICAHSVQQTSERLDLEEVHVCEVLIIADEEEEEEVAQHKPQQILCLYMSVELAADKWEMESNQPTVLQNCTRHAGKCYVKQTAKSIL